MTKSSWVLTDSDEKVQLQGQNFIKAVQILSSSSNSPTKKLWVGASNSPKKAFYEDPMTNPSLNNTHITSADDAHWINQELSWSRKGIRFPSDKRNFNYPKEQGPKKPETFPHIFEKPIVTYERKGEVLPLNKRIKSTERYKPTEIPDIHPIAPSPVSYTIPDPWLESSKLVCGSPNYSASFASSSKRFPDPPLIGASASSPYIIRTSEKGPVRSKPGVSILNPNLQRHEQNSLYSTLNSSTSSPLLSNSQSTSSFFDEPQLAFPTSTRPPSRSHLAGKSFGQKFPSLLSEAKGREEVKCYIREEVLDPITNEKVNTIRPVTYGEYEKSLYKTRLNKNKSSSDDEEEMNYSFNLSQRSQEELFSNSLSIQKIESKISTNALNNITESQINDTKLSHSNNNVDYASNSSNASNEPLNATFSIESYGIPVPSEIDLPSSDSESITLNSSKKLASTFSTVNLSYNKALLSKWTPTLCYSKKKTINFSKTKSPTLSYNSSSSNLIHNKNSYNDNNEKFVLGNQLEHNDSQFLPESSCFLRRPKTSNGSWQ